MHGSVVGVVHRDVDAACYVTTDLQLIDSDYWYTRGVPDAHKRNCPTWLLQVYSGAASCQYRDHRQLTSGIGKQIEIISRIESDLDDGEGIALDERDLITACHQRTTATPSSTRGPV